MSSLSSLLVQRELATIRDVEEALARQVLYGGDLATNLLEVAQIDEAPLTSTLAESYGLLPAPIGELPPTPADARAFVTREQASEQGVIPLGFDGTSLVLASSAPLTPEVEEELKAATQRPLVIRIAPIFRIYQAIARDYEAPLPRRYGRLLTRLGGKLPPPAPVVVPARATLVEFRPTSPEEAPKTVAEPNVFVEPISSTLGMEGPPTTPGGEAPRTATGPGTEAAITVVEDTVAEGPPATTVAEPAVTVVLPAETTPAPTPPTATSPEPAPAASAPVPAEPSRTAVAEPLPTVRASGFPASFVSGDARAHGRIGKRRRGPLTFAIAKKEMDEAGERDSVLDLVFEFSRQFFEYSAIFVVHGDLAEGRDAAGKGASRDKVASLGIPLDTPSLLASARSLLLPIFATPDPAGFDAVLFRDLERSGRCSVVAIPIVVRRRLVALFLGDDGEANVEAAGVQEVTSFAALAGAAFERLIVRKKKDGRPTGAPSRGPGGPSSMPVELPTFTREPLPTFPQQPVPVIPAPTEPASPVTVELPAPEPVAAEPPAVLEQAERSVAAPVHEPAAEQPAPVEAAPVEPSAEPATAPVEPSAEPATAPVEPSAEPASADGRPTLVDSPRAAPPSELPPTVGAKRLELSPRPMVDAEAEALPPIPSSKPRELDSSPPPTMRRGRDSLPGSGSPSAPPSAPRPVEDNSGFSLSEPALPGPEPVGVVVPAPAPLPVDSERVAVAARRPPTRSDLPTGLPSVIVDVDNQYVELVDRVVGTGDEEAETQLLHAGQYAMPAILARFPGPLKVSLAAPPEGGLPRASECGALLRLVARQRRVALPFLLTVVDERDVDRRFWATYLLSELPYIESIEPAVRALFDADARVRGAARAAVRVLGELYPTFTVERLARVLGEAEHDTVRKVITLQLLGELREAGSVAHLVPRLADARPEVAAAARSSLILVTRQDFGLHVAHWNEWSAANRGRQRVEWLIDALGHPASGIRQAALDELVKLTRSTYGYQEEMSKRDRDRVIQRFRDWWAVEGRARFGR